MVQSQNEDTQDQQWMQEYLEGETDSFQKLYRRHSSKVMGYLVKRLQSAEEREEVFQQAWMKFHTSRESYDAHYPVLQWIFVVTRSVLLDHVKKKGREIVLDYVESDEKLDRLSQNSEHRSDAEPENSERDWSEKLKALKPDQARVIELRVRDEMSFQEIALKLKKSQASVRQILSRAMRTLRKGAGT